MTYQQFLSEISTYRKFGIRLGLENIRRLMEALGSPQKTLKIIHVTGTNGKGSVSNFLMTILSAYGFKTGLFTSPHLCSVAERFIINGSPVSREKISDVYRLVKKACEKIGKNRNFSPTYFEIMTAMAMAYFNLEKTDYVVLETGLGGRLDATNIFPDILCVITTVAKDHTEHLGDSIAGIAYEKAAIIKRGSKVVIGNVPSAALKVIERTCKKLKVSPKILGRDFKVDLKETGLKGSKFDFNTGNLKIKNLELRKAIGANQVENASVAIMGIKEILPVEEKCIKSVKKAFWPGRFEILRRKNGTIVIDCAHNPHGMRTFRRNMELFGKKTKFDLVFGVLKDKDYRKMIKEIPFERFNSVTAVVPPVPDRALNAGILAGALRKESGGVSVREGESLEKVIKYHLSRKTNIAVAGSLFLAGETRKILKLCMGE
ncbi:bifunctional folylpolyglutamate synthase/dihydrofolate synthase [bacterium]|jgi:dihydrofolate synthase/folylpolyglutamate synthase|nr:bifunctional folylpolyglutamate synthase/dihydrofolate synthase [bacterium]